MDNIISILQYIYYFLLWCLYFMLTLSERNRYEEGLKRNMNCVGSVTRAGSITFEFNPNSKPIRRYQTWSEYWLHKSFNKPKIKLKYRPKDESLKFTINPERVIRTITIDEFSADNNEIRDRFIIQGSNVIFINDLSADLFIQGDYHKS